MKRYILLTLSGILIVGSAAPQSLRGATMYVSVKSAQLKSGTGLFANTTGTLEYGSQVTVLQEQGKWVEVQSIPRGPTGWMAASGLTSKRIVSSAGSASSARELAMSGKGSVSGTGEDINLSGRGDGGAAASAREVALAGKGFSQEVEQAYKEENALDYTFVNTIEAEQVSDQELQDFLVKGHLITEE